MPAIASRGAAEEFEAPPHRQRDLVGIDELLEHLGDAPALAQV